MLALYMLFVPRHTPDVILAECRAAGTTGIFMLGNHAIDRMEERNISRGDVRHALMGATAATFQPDKGRWKIVGGTDRAGVLLDIAVVLQNGIFVVTVF